MCVPSLTASGSRSSGIPCGLPVSPIRISHDFRFSGAPPLPTKSLPLGVRSLGRGSMVMRRARSVLAALSDGAGAEADGGSGSASTSACSAFSIQAS